MLFVRGARLACRRKPEIHLDRARFGSKDDWSPKRASFGRHEHHHRVCAGFQSRDGVGSVGSCGTFLADLPATSPGTADGCDLRSSDSFSVSVRYPYSNLSAVSQRCT